MLKALALLPLALPQIALGANSMDCTSSGPSTPESGARAVEVDHFPDKVSAPPPLHPSLTPNHH